MSRLVKMLPMIYAISGHRGGEQGDRRHSSHGGPPRARRSDTIAFPFRLYQKRLVITAIDLAWKNDGSG